MDDQRGSEQLKETSYHSLFKYLKFDVHNLKEHDCEAFHEPAIERLNAKDGDFDMKKVLPLIPKEWGCASLERFLVKGLRKSQHQRIQSAVQRGLARYENEQIKLRHMNIRSKVVFASEQACCDLCGVAFSEPDFVWLPFKRLLVHRHCFNESDNFSNESK